MILSGVDTADFNFLLSALRLSNGNLSSHMRHLEDAGYVEVTKAFEGRTPRTTYCTTGLGRARLDAYWRTIDDIRGARKPGG